MKYNFIYDYDIHNLCRIRIKSQKKFFVKGFDPLSFFKVSQLDEDPDITLHIGQFTPNLRDSIVVDHTYNIKPNYLFCKDQSGSAKWMMEISGIENSPIDINFNGNITGLYGHLFPNILAQDVGLLPMLELYFGLKGYLLAHAGGIVINENALLFFGRGGSHKTNIMLDLMKKFNGKILGDDRILIDIKKERVFSFPIYHSIFEYTYKNMNNEYFSQYKKLQLILHLYKNNARIDIWERDPKIVKEIFLLRKFLTNDKNFDMKQIGKEITLKKILNNNRAESYITTIPGRIIQRNFPTYLIAYSYVYPKSKIANYWDNMNQLIRGFLEQLSLDERLLYEINMPEKYSEHIFNDFIKLSGL
jgi:hypothetical protein